MALFPQEVIRRKRDGATLTTAEIEFLVRGITDGSLADAQVAGFAMAVFFRGMTAAETFALTDAMVRSGDSLSSIAQRFRVTVKKLMEWNAGAGNNYLQPGQRLVVFVDATEHSG